jgi:cell division protein FtsN
VVAAARAVTPGNYTVQVAAFAVAANAETTRDRVNARLAAAGDQLQAGERTAQVVRSGERSFVVIGDHPSRAGAEDLAKRLRSVLNQDVAVIRM